jgi:pimeloyl-ACP methyl ester carboxylesterase
MIMRSILCRTLLLLTAVVPACSHSSQSDGPGVRKTLVKSGYAPVNGLNLYYEIHGQGRPLVLIHGGGSTIESNWGRMLPLLERSRQVIAIEEQGHGHTAAIDRPFTFENSADDVAALLDYLKIEKADVMGFSNGGNIALRVGQRHPDKVKKLVAISCMYRRDGMVPGFWEGFAKPDIGMMPQALKDADRKINSDPKHLQQLFEQDVKRMADFRDWPDADLSNITAPTLVMVGDRDIVLPEHALKMARLLPKGRLMVVPGTHGDFLGEVETQRPDSVAPRGVATLVEAFLDEDR